MIPITQIKNFRKIGVTLSSPPAEWTHIGLPWLVLDYDASVGVQKAGGVPATDGDVITSIQDQSGNNHHSTVSGTVNFISSDARAGGMPSFGSATSAGTGGIVTPTVDARVVYMVASYKDGTDATFDASESLFSGNGPTYSDPHYYGDTGTNTVTPGLSGRIGQARLNAGLPVDAILPLPLSVIRVPRDFGTVTRQWGVGHWIGVANRRWPGAILRFSLTTGEETADEAARLMAVMAHDAGIQASLSNNNAYKVVRPTTAVNTLDGLPADILSSTLLFADDFDSQADWTPASNPDVHYKPGTGSEPPTNWDFHYQWQAWNPVDLAHSSSEPAIQISNAHARGTGKSLLIYDESRGDNTDWGSNGVLAKQFTESPDVYAEVWIQFQPAYRWQCIEEGGGISYTKALRLCHFDEGPDNSPFQNGGTGYLGPLIFLDTMVNTNTVEGTPVDIFRLESQVRCDPQGTNYYCGSYATGAHANLPTKPRYTEVFDGGWHKLGMRVKMNTVPGTADGICQIWFDNELIQTRTDIPFLGVGSNGSLGWNNAQIGGNQNNVVEPDSVKLQQWWAMDDFKVFAIQ